MARAVRKTGSELVWEILHGAWSHAATARFRGGVVASLGAALALSLATYSAGDPS